MFKICITVRDRLAITKKCIEAIKRHSTIDHQIYIYNNSTKFYTKQHFEYFWKLYENNLITQVTFNTDDSTFNAFGKAVAFNQFGRLHMEDPNKGKYDFLLLLDNDIIVTENFDRILTRAWRDVEKYKLDYIKIIGQMPGGIKDSVKLQQPIAGFEAKEGRLGGSGLWSMRTNFFKDVGFLNLKNLVGFFKKQDQMYWRVLSKASSKPGFYILGLKHKLGLHCGKYTGSICNTLSRGGLAKYEESKANFIKLEKDIESQSFSDFYEMIQNDKEIVRSW